MVLKNFSPPHNLMIDGGLRTEKKTFHGIFQFWALWGDVWFYYTASSDLVKNGLSSCYKPLFFPHKSKTESVRYFGALEAYELMVQTFAKFFSCTANLFLVQEISSPVTSLH